MGESNALVTLFLDVCWREVKRRQSSGTLLTGYRYRKTFYVLFTASPSIVKWLLGATIWSNLPLFPGSRLYHGITQLPNKGYWHCTKVLSGPVHTGMGENNHICTLRQKNLYFFSVNVFHHEEAVDGGSLPPCSSRVATSCVNSGSALPPDVETA